MGTYPEELAFALIKREAASREAAISALRDQLLAMEGQLNQEISGVGARLTADIEGRTVNSSAIVGTIRMAQVEPGFASAYELSTLEAQVTADQETNEAAIQESRTAIADLDGAFARFSRSTRVKAGQNEARILVIETTYATQDFAEAKKTEAISASTAYTDGEISSLSSVYATPTDVTATVTSQISASIASSAGGTIGGAINTEATARATADGLIHAQWGVSIDINGNIVGRIHLDGTGETSEFGVLASKFTVTDASTGVVPFQIVGTKAKFTSDVEIDGSLVVAGTISASKLDFTPLDDTNVIATINASSEGIRIQGYKIFIDGNVSFSTGYDPSAKIESGGAAADINTNVTTINGGKITTGSIDADKLNVTSLSAINANLGTVTAGTIDVGSTWDRVRLLQGEVSCANVTIMGLVGSSYVRATSASDGSYVELTGPHGPSPASLSAVQGGLLKASISASGVAQFIQVNDSSGNKVVGTQQAAPAMMDSSYSASGTYGSDISNIQALFADHASQFNTLRSALIAHGLIA